MSKPVGLYAILDRVAEEAGPLFQARNDGVALRMFNQMLEKEQVKIDDFRLYLVGYYDPESLEICPQSPSKEVWRGAEGDIPSGAPPGVGG